MKKTPLYDEHVSLGGRIVEFAGWQMPVQYSGVIAEHVATREAVGLFDVSHMGEIWVTGPEAEKALEYLTCNRVSALYDGKAQYSALLNDDGGVIDDIIVYRFASDKFLLCVNASNADRDFAWLSERNPTKASIRNASAEYGQIAVQGPKALALVSRLVDADVVRGIKPFHFVESSISGAPVILARTGYTGEDGLEIFVPAESTVTIWRELLAAGKDLGAIPCGLGARDSLRLEAALPLHGHELAEEISALESGLGWIVKFDKGEFIGRAALAQQLQAGLKRKLVGFELDEAGIARQGDGVAIVTDPSSSIGIVTSGTKTPTLNKALGMALVDSERAVQGEAIAAVVRGRSIRGHIVGLPFYRRSKDGASK